MKENTYIIRITTIDGLHIDYISTALNLFFAKMEVLTKFFEDYPDADKNIKLSLQNPTKENITEIIEIIRKKVD